MDNVVIGVDSHSEICGVYKEAKSIFGKAAMNLSQWTSNFFKSLEFIPSCERSTVSMPLTYLDCRGISLKIKFLLKYLMKW